MRYFIACFLLFCLASKLCHAEPADPKAYLQMIYEGKGGYTIPSEEIAAIAKDGGHSQYGEIPYDSSAHILEDLNLSRQDVFYDLGSGVGKLVLQVYLNTPVKRSVGIELSTTRWNIAETSRKQVNKDDHITTGRDLTFLNQNIRQVPLTDATVCFISGVAFPLPLIQSILDRLGALDHEVKVISILPLPEHKQLRLIKTYNLPMSWAPEGVEVCLYQVTPPQDTTGKAEKGNRKRKRKVQQEED
jgi:hypothetical protein